MHRPSKVDRLPPEIREKIAALRDDGHTLDEIMQHLGKIGLDADGMPSRSGLGRHVQNLDSLAELINQQRRTAEVLARRPDDPGAADRSLQLNVELMHGLLTRLVAASSVGDDATMSAKEIGFLSRSLQALASAQRADAVTKMAIRKDMQVEMEKKVSQIEEDVETKRLTPAEILERIRAVYRGES